MESSSMKTGNVRWSYLSQLSVNYFGWAFCWFIASAYIVPNMMLGMVDNSVKNSRLGFMTGVANILLLALLPLLGTISDRLRSKIGRRRPFYLSAILASSIITILYVPSRYYPVLFALVFLIHGAEASWFINYALIRDIVPLERRGRISGLTSIMSTIGVLLAHAVSPRFITTGRVMSLALIGAAVNIFCGLWVALRIKERPPVEPPPPITSWKEIYLPKLEGTSGLGWLAGVNLFTQMGAVAMTCFLLYFIKDQIDSEHFNETFRNANLIGTGPAVISAISAGWIADRFGRKRILAVACLLQIVSMVNFLVFPWTHATLYVTGLLFGLGNAAYWSLYWTLLSDLVPEGETSKYIGLIQYTTMIPWAVVPPTLGAIVDGLGAESGRGYNMLFVVIVIFLAVGMALIRGIPETLTTRSKAAAAVS
jgi:MFS family permease